MIAGICTHCARRGADFVISETYYSALELGKQALGALGKSEADAERLAAAFDQAEERGREALYEQWLKKGEGERYSRDFQALFIELEEALEELMHADEAAAQPFDEASDAREAVDTPREMPTGA